MAYFMIKNANVSLFGKRENQIKVKIGICNYIIFHLSNKN